MIDGEEKARDGVLFLKPILKQVIGPFGVPFAKLWVCWSTRGEVLKNTCAAIAPYLESNH
ncbi:MAG: hypothetical protein KME45_25700 [Stenomitos rutilans HA7619-LM2]|jgi:hypothetical protein|nr:hypothetical protein [Stenomitos rutilans HA7619-LM2]